MLGDAEPAPQRLLALARSRQVHRGARRVVGVREVEQRLPFGGDAHAGEDDVEALGHEVRDERLPLVQHPLALEPRAPAELVAELAFEAVDRALVGDEVERMVVARGGDHHGLRAAAGGQERQRRHGQQERPERAPHPQPPGGGHRPPGQPFRGSAPRDAV